MPRLGGLDRHGGLVRLGDLDGLGSLDRVGGLERLRGMGGMGGLCPRLSRMEPYMRRLDSYDLDYDGFDDDDDDEDDDEAYLLYLRNARRRNMRRRRGKSRTWRSHRDMTPSPPRMLTGATGLYGGYPYL